MNEMLTSRIRATVISGGSLEQLWHVLHDFKEAGGERADAYSALEKLKSELDAPEEDLLLEAMDCVNGFCNVSDRIWVK